MPTEAIGRQKVLPRTPSLLFRTLIRIGVYGSEFDVHITRDGEVVVFHDDDVDGIKIENANYADIKDKRLKNGEKIPTLKDYLNAAKSLGDMKLILEVKEHIQKSDEDRCIDATLKMVREAGLEARTEYISFSKHACDYLVRHAPGPRFPISMAT